MDDGDHGCTRTVSKHEDDALVGNVNKVMITPPEHKGRPKHGHLIFNANFESGNDLRLVANLTKTDSYAIMLFCITKVIWLG